MGLRDKIVGVFSRPHALSYLEGGWNPAATHRVYHTVFYLYGSYCLQLTGSDSVLKMSCQWFAAIGGPGRPELRLLEPQSIDWARKSRVLASQ